MSAKVVKLSVAGQWIQIIVSSSHLEYLLNGLLKKVFKTAIISDYFVETCKEDEDEVVDVEIKTCWYRQQTKYKSTVVCKAVIDSKPVVLLYHKMLHPSKASDLRKQVMTATKLNLKYWVE
jgi:hypothetical protein